ncbi:MAG: alpha/beta hydrolase, partial [Candidatus Coproplasma sp.]
LPLSFWKFTMDEIKRVKLKTGMQVAFGRLIYSFNRHIKGVSAKNNLSYCADGDIRHTLNVTFPKEGKEGGYPCIIYLHGGGWSGYDKSLFRSTAKELAACGAVVFNCNYCLAPKHNFADMEQDVQSITDFVRQNAARFGGNPDRIIFSGDSSGAHLSALYVNRAFYYNAPVAKFITGCAFFYGVYDLTTVGEVNFNNKAAYTKAAMPLDMPNREEYLREYSPISYICPSLPPTLFCSGMIDPLHAGQSGRYSKALEELGVSVERLFFPVEEETATHRFITFTKCTAAKKSFDFFRKFLKTLENA